MVAASSVLLRIPERFTKALGRLRRAQTPQRWVGLDLGGQSIKLVELEATPQGMRLINSLIQELPTTMDGQPIDRSGWLQTALEAFKTQEVHVAIGGSEVAIRRVRLPSMPAREVTEAVKWQVKDQLPFPVQDAVIDCTIEGEVWDKDLRKQDVLVAAVSTVHARAHADLVQQAGARVSSMAPSPCAGWWVIAALMPELKTSSVAIVDVGASETHVTVVKDGHVRLVRDLAIGSARLSESLMGVISGERGEVTIDFHKAENLKRRYGVLTDAATGMTDEGVPLFHLASLMRPVLENLLTELSRLLSFYKVQMEEAGVSRILLCGGGAEMKSLSAFLAEGLGLTVEVFNPLVRIADRLQSLEPEQITEQGPRLVVALGTALGHGQRLNLLPIPLRSRHQLANWAGIGRQAIRAAAGIAAAVLVALGLGLAVTQWQIARQQKQWNTLEPSYTRYMQTTAALKGAESTMAQVQRFLDEQPVWDGLMKELGVVMPASLVLDELDVRPADDRLAWRIHLTGHAVSGVAGAQSGLSHFVESLKASPFFAEVELVSSEMHTGSTGTTSVEIEGRLN